MTETTLLNITDLSISLPKGAERPLAVDRVSIAVKPGKITCIVGESGSGKSMIAKAILDILPGRGITVSGGTIRLSGEDLVQLSADEMRKVRGARISMIFQEPMTALNPLIRIGDQIAEVLEEHTDLPARERRKQVLTLLDDVHLPDPAGIARAYPHQLSGGQRQRAMIAMALILEPELIIADEPTTALDVTTQAQILKLVAELQREKGMGVLFITHDFGVVAEIADQVVVIQHGKVVEEGSRDAILNEPQQPYTQALIAAVPGLTPPKLMAVENAPILEVENLNKTFSSGGGLFGGGRRAVHAVSDVSLTLSRGETLGIIGESGSGKSTLARLIVRLIEADSGNVRFQGQDILTLSGRDLINVRAKIQMAFQDPFASLNPRQKVGKIIAEGLRLRGHAPSEARGRVEELLKMVDMPASAADRFPHEFSGGQRQRIGIARAVAVEPEVLVADEVVSALDVSVQLQVLELLQDIKERLGLSMLFITPDLCVAAQVCDRLIVMQRGKCVETGRSSELLQNPQEAYTQALLKSVPGQDWLRKRRHKRSA
jgi:peptide/nickel transport system ATP-binding protein